MGGGKGGGGWRGWRAASGRGRGRGAPAAAVGVHVLVLAPASVEALLNHALFVDLRRLPVRTMVVSGLAGCALAFARTPVAGDVPSQGLRRHVASMGVGLQPVEGSRNCADDGSQILDVLRL